MDVACSFQTGSFTKNTIYIFFFLPLKCCLRKPCSDKRNQILTPRLIVNTHIRLTFTDVVCKELLALEEVMLEILCKPLAYQGKFSGEKNNKNITCLSSNFHQTVLKEEQLIKILFFFF